ncbi:MAG: hypothetical protein LH606_18665, partial [Cytophagaceae bacterium]|nr:hypothetical protein [Cytophagaceae bacterium]
MLNLLTFFARLLAGSTLLLCAFTSPAQTTQELPDGVNDEAPFSYQGPNGYGSQYNPVAKFGEIILPRDFVPFTLEAVAENVYHNPATPLWKVGFTHTWDADETRERSVFSTNSGNLYTGTGYAPSGGSPLYPETITPSVIQNVIGPRIANSDILVHDYELGDPSPEELAKPGFVAAWIHATLTGPLGYARARGQRTSVYGAAFMGGTKFDQHAPWGSGFGTDWRVWQKRSYGVDARDHLFWSYDPYGVRPREVVSFPRVSDLQPLGNFMIFYQRTGSSPGAPYYPLGILLQDPAVAPTGLVSSATVPTRYRLEELPGQCGAGSRTFRFTLEDEAGNRVNNWVASGWIPSTQTIYTAQTPTSANSKPVGFTHADRIPNRRSQSPSIQSVEAVIPAPRAGVGFQTRNGGNFAQRFSVTTFAQGSAVATVCIVNDIPGGEAPAVGNTLEECDEVLLKMWGQSVHSRKLEPTLIPWHTASPVPHTHNDVGFIATGVFPEYYLPALILHAANQQAAVTLWGHTMFTEQTKFASGRSLDNVIAARKRVKLREALAFSAQTVRPDYALQWNGVDVWTKNTEFAPSNGDPDRYDPVWIYRVGANAGNNHFINQANRYTVPVPLITVCQNGNKVWIVGTMIGKVEPNATNTYTVKVRPAGNESNVKAYSITLNGKRTTSVTYTLDAPSPPPPTPSACAVTKVRIYPRPNCCAGRTIGARIQVSTTGSNGPWQTVFTVP